jgi:hypothetical protein
MSHDNIKQGSVAYIYAPDTKKMNPLIGCYYRVDVDKLVIEVNGVTDFDEDGDAVAQFATKYYESIEEMKADLPKSDYLSVAFPAGGAEDRLYTNVFNDMIEDWEYLNFSRAAYPYVVDPDCTCAENELGEIAAVEYKGRPAVVCIDTYDPVKKEERGQLCLSVATADEGLQITVPIKEPVGPFMAITDRAGMEAGRLALQKMIDYGAMDVPFAVPISARGNSEHYAFAAYQYSLARFDPIGMKAHVWQQNKDIVRKIDRSVIESMINQPAPAPGDEPVHNARVIR